MDDVCLGLVTRGTCEANHENKQPVVVSSASISRLGMLQDRPLHRVVDMVDNRLYEMTCARHVLVDALADHLELPSTSACFCNLLVTKCVGS